MCDISSLKIHRRCKTPQDPMVVFIQKEHEVNIGLCDKCWGKVANSDLEWGSDPKPIFEELIGRRAKEEGEATLTIYDPSKMGKARYQEVEDET